MVHLEYREHRWVHRNPTASRRSAQRNRGTVKVALVPKIAG
ncbi:MAG: hypothetical protein Q3965_00850 [Rothia sp. (in: high G+C Gram-positive bacteria)]|nr:hypothetical protein [Rothia sp. (in: high G+C Gram-positive bacteria)]